jgi:hypothetical protein
VAVTVTSSSIVCIVIVRLQLHTYALMHEHAKPRKRYPAGCPDFFFLSCFMESLQQKRNGENIIVSFDASSCRRLANQGHHTNTAFPDAER